MFGLTTPQAHTHKSPLWATDRPTGALWPEFLAELTLCSPCGVLHSASHICLCFQQEQKEALCVSREIFFFGLPSDPEFCLQTLPGEASSPPRLFFGFSQFTRGLAFRGESLFRCRTSGFPKMLTLMES